MDGVSWTMAGSARPCCPIRRRNWNRRYEPHEGHAELPTFDNVTFASLNERRGFASAGRIEYGRRHPIRIVACDREAGNGRSIGTLTEPTAMARGILL